MATTYYTDWNLGNDGNLGTSAGAGNAWKTIEHALATMVSGDTLNIADGTYLEDSSASGQLKLRGQNLTLQGSSGVAANVIIKGASHADTSVAQTGSITGSTFKNITFQALGIQTVTLNLLLAQQSTGVLFQNCFAVANNVAAAFGVLYTSSSSTTNSYTWTACGFTKTNATGSTGNPFVCAATASDNVTLVFNNCTASSASGEAVWLDGGGSGTYTVTGGTFSSSSTLNSAFLFGRDSGTGLVCHGSITGATVTSTGNHALEFGDHATIVGTNCVITGQNYGVVLKNAQSCQLTGNTITNATANAAVLLKGGTGNIVAANTLISSAGPCIKNWDSGGGPTVPTQFCNYSCTVENNRLILTGSASYMDWRQINGNGDQVDGGGNLVDFQNIYFNGIGMNFGNVNGVSSIATLATLRSTWNITVIDTGFDLNTVVSTNASVSTTVMSLPYTSSGLSMYTTIQNVQGLYWNNSTSAFEVFVLANWPLYGVLTTEYPIGSAYYSATVPVNLPLGMYWYSIFTRGSYFNQTTDACILRREGLSWSGTTRFSNIFPVRKNTAFTNYLLYMVLSSDHVSPATGKTVSVTRTIDGATIGACTNSPATEVGAGVYKITLTAADLNGNNVMFIAAASGCDPLPFQITNQG